MCSLCCLWDAGHGFYFDCCNNFSSDVLHNSTFPGEETQTWPRREKTAGALFKVITNCRVTAILTKEPGTSAWFLHELGRPSRSDIFLLCRTTVSSDITLYTWFWRCVSLQFVYADTKVNLYLSCGCPLICFDGLMICSVLLKQYFI